MVDCGGFSAKIFKKIIQKKCDKYDKRGGIKYDYFRKC